MARASGRRRRRDGDCYRVRREGRTAAGTLLRPWGRRTRRRPPPGLDRFGPPAEDQPPLVPGPRPRRPEPRPTVGPAPRGRLARALREVRAFPALETEATAYDATIAAGPAHLLVAANFDVAVHAKTPGKPLATAKLREWFDDVLPAEVDIVFDPRVLFDQHAQRWVLVATGAHYEDFSHPYQLLSVSSGADPLGDWWVWALREPGGAKVPWPDHPCVGVDAHALYLTANMIGAATPARLRVLPKAAALAGGRVAYTEFDGLLDPGGAGHDRPVRAGSVFPCHTWGTPDAEYLVSARRVNEVESALTLWTVADPAGRPALTCRRVGVAPYAVGVPWALQRGGPPLATGDARVRSAACIGGTIWLAFATAYRTVAAVRWYELTPAGRVLQEGVFATDEVHHCYPAIVPDVERNAALVTGRAALGEWASVQVAARRWNDDPNQLSPPQLVQAGTTGHRNPDRNGVNRWGDYHAVALDPADGRTIWLCGGVPMSDKRWRLYVASLRI